MNTTKLREATRRVEQLYWDCHRNGGPDLELLAILRLLEEAPVENDAGNPIDDEAIELTEEPPLPAA
jgi:hypothetical protein